MCHVAMVRTLHRQQFPIEVKVWFLLSFVALEL